MSFIFEPLSARNLPAPKIDRVGFPAGYKETFTPLYTFDNFQNRQIRAVWGNSIAASVQPGQSFNFPYGSVLLFESYSVQQDTSGEPVLDEDGKFIPTNLTTIFVMRKEKGFGEDYKELRNGEWEYAAYRPDGTTSTAPEATGACAQCHLTGGALPVTAESRAIGAQYVFRPDLYFGKEVVPRLRASCSTTFSSRTRFMRNPAKSSPFTTAINYCTGSWPMMAASIRECSIPEGVSP